MKHVYRPICVIAAALFFIGTMGAFAQDWPQWRGANRDGKVSGFIAPQTWPNELAPKWKKTVGAGDASPALVGDKIYIFTRQGDDEVIACLNAANGDVVWQNKYAAEAIPPPSSRHPGPRSSPAVGDGKVVALGVRGVLSCLDAATGKELWRKDEFPGLAPKYFTAMSPIIVDGMAIAQLGGEGQGGILAFDLNTGSQKWKWTEEGPAYASPALMTVAGTKQLVTLTEKSVVGVGVADGKLLWKVPFAPQGMQYNAATPIIDGQTVYVTGQGRGTKSLTIEKQGDGFTAKENWSNDKVAVQFCTPVLKDGLLFGLTDKGNLFCVNAKTGAEAWQDTVKRGGSFAAVLDAGSVILALPNTSELIAFKPTDKEYSEVAKIKIAETPTYAHPVIAGNRVFVKDQDSLALLSLQ